MKVIILAAGVGQRLASTHHGPKCLLEIDGRSLLQRHLDALAALDIHTVTLCLGYQAARVAAALDSRAGHLLHYNPLFRLGSIVSLWCARQTLLSGDDVLVMDADVLYHPDILGRLVNSSEANCFLIDRDFVAGDEPVKICLENGRIVEFRKQIAAGLPYNRVGESVGFFKFDAATAQRLGCIVAAYVACEKRELPHEEALRELALEPGSDIGVEDVTGLPWIEIDYPEDITRAVKEIAPRISQRR